MSDHTPGPWSVYGYEIVSEDGQRVATASTPARPHPEERANARLIAASPELLAVLRGILTNAGSHIDTEWLELATAIIAQAEGREP
jgi:hypothetical protein